MGFTHASSPQMTSRTMTCVEDVEIAAAAFAVYRTQVSYWLCSRLQVYRHHETQATAARAILQCNCLHPVGGAARDHLQCAPVGKLHGPASSTAVQQSLALWLRLLTAAACPDMLLQVS